MKENTLGERLKRLRIQKGVTQKNFADALNVSPSAVSKWENGQNVPDMEMLLAIARYYGKSLEELLEGELKKADDINDNPDSKAENAENQKESLNKNKDDSRMKWFGAGIALGCVMTLFLVTVVILLGKILFGLNSNFSYEIVAERYVEDKEWEEIYQVSVFYSGELTDERQKEITADIMNQWESGDLCDMDTELIMVICNDNKESAQNFETLYQSVIIYLAPHNMEYS